ncbi:hypothetical protein UPYG_G00087790 [Umbra pygmaea]|uniref:PH domain-containing protein n=1 Tax=Umbra pygmaea TaxID=75934 RepID=A0ABD0Y4F1_UMBPY
MEDEVKEDSIVSTEEPAKPKETKSQWKSGWVKKASGRFLASYKDRYIEVEKTGIVVYENEDLATCLERLDLENYDKCHELKTAFKKKNRLVLIRAAKSGNKVHDVKFQAQNPEEKEAWIKALSDCISRAKNKIFDEVKVDDSSNLEHVTRSRPKANRNRRPPTRTHMKEVANVSSDGILRLDLDVVDASTPNGTHHITADGTEPTVKPPMQPTSNQAPEEALTPQTSDQVLATKEEPRPQKVLKPPMPPSKDAKSATVGWDDVPEESSTGSCPEKKVLKPPMPPSKGAKPTVSADDQAPGETSPDKKVIHPPMPPSKVAKPSAPAGDPPNGDKSREGNPEDCSNSGVESAPPRPADDLAKGSQSSLLPAPTPPHKDKKPTQTGLENVSAEPGGPEKEPKEDDDGEGNDEESSKSMPGALESGIPPGAKTDLESSSSQITITMTTLEAETPVTDHPEVTDTNFYLSPNKKRAREEEKSVDSGQHSNDDDEGSEDGDNLAASTAALMGSLAGLDTLMDESEDGDTPDSLGLEVEDPPSTSQSPRDKALSLDSTVLQKTVSQAACRPAIPLKPVTKFKSASMNDLLSEPQMSEDVTTAGSLQDDDVTNLKNEVALEMEKTKKLLGSIVPKGSAGVPEDGSPEELLARAMEKLRKADEFLREAENMKESQYSKNMAKRISW